MIFFSNGEMGIANTTTSSAILYSLTKADIDKIVGIGGGLTDEALKNKKNIIIKACEKYNTFDMDAIDVLKYVEWFRHLCNSRYVHELYSLQKLC